MAKGETLSGLYLRIGLNYAELNQDFVRVEETLQANMARLNRREQLINLRAKIDLSGAISSTEQLRIQQSKLQQIIEITQERLKIYKAELKGTEQAFGTTNKLTEQARIQVSKYELALARLTEELKKVERQQKQTSDGNKLLEGYRNLKGNTTERLSGLADVWNSVRNSSTSADMAIETLLGTVGKIPTPVGVAVAAIAAIPIVTKAAESALLSLTEPAMKAGDALYVMGRGMQMNMEDTMKLATICKITGIEISEVAATLKRFNTRIMAATSVDDPRLKMLERYGAKIRDVNGHLKNNIEMSAELGKALKKAQAEGNGIAFRDVIFARYVSGDFITYLEDFADNYEASKKIVKNKLADPALAHAVQGNMNTLNTQIEELKGVASMALLPAANEVISRLTEQFGKLTEVIAESKDGIMAFGSAAASVINNVGDLTTAITSKAIKAVSVLGELFTLSDKNLNSHYAKDANKLTIAGEIPAELQRLTTLDDFVNQELQRNYTYTERRAIESNPNLYQLTRSKYQSQFDTLMKKREQLEKEADLYVIIRNLQNENIKSAQDLMNQEMKVNRSAEEGQEINSDPARFEQTLDRYKRAFQKLDVVRKYLDDDTIKTPEDLLQAAFSSKLAGLKKETKEYQKLYEELLKTSEEIFALFDKIKQATNPPRFRETEELSSLQLEAIKKQLAEERALTDELYKITHSDFEGKKFDLLKWRGDILNDETKTSNQKETAEKIYSIKLEQLEQEQADKIQKIRDSVNAEFQSDIDRRIASIEQEKQAWIEAGMEEAEAVELAQLRIAKVYEDRAKKLDEIRDKVNALNQTELENKFIEIDRQSAGWQDIGMEESEATQLAERLKLEAVQNLEKEFSSALNNLRQTDLEKQLARIEEERQAWIKKGIDEARATQLAEEQKAAVIGEVESTLNDKRKQLNDKLKERAKIYKEFEEQARQASLQVQSIWDTDLNNRLKQIEEEKRAYRKKGVDEVALEEWVAQAKVNAERDAARQILTTQLKAYRAFNRGGYAALKKYELGQLYKQGVSKKDIESLTSENLHRFTVAQKAVQHSLFPNFMTEQDRQLESAAISGKTYIDLPEVGTGLTGDIAERLADNSEAIRELTEEIQKLEDDLQNNSLGNAGASYANLPVDLGKNQAVNADVTGINLSESNTAFSDFAARATENLRDLVTDITDVGKVFETLADKIGNFGNTPTSITNNVSINEAHAWDYSHIQALADMVADVITPRILGALGGGLNGY